MTEQISSAGFLAPELSAKVGQLISMAEAMGVVPRPLFWPAIKWTVEHSSDWSEIWDARLGFGNASALADASDRWNHIANQIGDSISKLNSGANIALGRSSNPFDPTTLPSALPSGDIWQGESATNFATYVDGLTATGAKQGALVGLQQDAMSVANGMSAASTSCYELVAIALATVVSAGAAAAGLTLLALASAAVGFSVAFIGKIIDSLDKFQAAGKDIRDGRNPPPGVQEDGQFQLPGGQSTVLPDGQSTPLTLPPDF